MTIRDYRVDDVRRIIGTRIARAKFQLSPKFAHAVDKERALATTIELACLQSVLDTMAVFWPEAQEDKDSLVSPLEDTHAGSLRNHLETAAQRQDAQVSQYLADLDLAVKGGNQDNIDHFFVAYSLAVASRAHAYRLLETMDLWAKSELAVGGREAHAEPADRPAT